MALVDVPFSELQSKYGDSDDEDTTATAAQEVLSLRSIPHVMDADAVSQTVLVHENINRDLHIREDEDSYHDLKEDEYDYEDVLSGDGLDALLEAETRHFAGESCSKCSLACLVPTCLCIAPCRRRLLMLECAFCSFRRAGPPRMSHQERGPWHAPRAKCTGMPGGASQERHGAAAAHEADPGIPVCGAPLFTMQLRAVAGSLAFQQASTTPLRKCSLRCAGWGSP